MGQPKPSPSTSQSITCVKSTISMISITPRLSLSPQTFVLFGTKDGRIVEQSAYPFPDPTKRVPTNSHSWGFFISSIPSLIQEKVYHLGTSIMVYIKISTHTTLLTNTPQVIYGLPWKWLTSQNPL